MVFLDKNIDTSTVDNYHGPLALLSWYVLTDRNLLVWLVNYTDELQGDLVLEVHAEMR